MDPPPLAVGHTHAIAAGRLVESMHAPTHSLCRHTHVPPKLASLPLFVCGAPAPLEPRSNGPWRPDSHLAGIGRRGGCGAARGGDIDRVRGIVRITSNTQKWHVLPPVRKAYSRQGLRTTGPCCPDPHLTIAGGDRQAGRHARGEGVQAAQRG